MPLFLETEKDTAHALVCLGYSNPFLPERIESERLILGKHFVATDGAWHKHVEDEAERPNIQLLTQRAKELADMARQRLAQGVQPNEVERELYADTVLYYLFNKYTGAFFEYVRHCEDVADVKGDTAGTAMVADLFAKFQQDMNHYLSIRGASFAVGDVAHIFACFFQLRRAWHNIYDNIIGGSMASARLRAAVWQSIFTCDMRRYRRAIYSRMGDITTLITGPSGTGKELVARAIGLSRYVPFDAKAKRFASDFARCFYPINLSALSPTLIESELFGHRKGSFTGAVADRTGFFEICPADGAIFLDEIGDLDPLIQVKLLRVLQMRSFQRIGDPTERHFEGKVIAATNRDPATEMEAGRFRQDLYYRLCSDLVVTPSLKEQIEGSPEQLHNLLLFITRRVAGPEEAEALAQDVASWIEKHLDPDYAWPGNVRELEQCVRNIMIRRSYQPSRGTVVSAGELFLGQVKTGKLTADELLRYYCTLVYAQTGSYVETARRLQIDRRTVKDRVDLELLDMINNS